MVQTNITTRSTAVKLKKLKDDKAQTQPSHFLCTQPFILLIWWISGTNFICKTNLHIFWPACLPTTDLFCVNDIIRLALLLASVTLRRESKGRETGEQGEKQLMTLYHCENIARSH